MHVKATPFVHYPCASRFFYCFGARICFCGAHRSRGLSFRCRLAFVLWLRSPLGFLLMASKRAQFALCPFVARFAFCLSVCALSFRRSVSCFACCPAASRVCYCSLWLRSPLGVLVMAWKRAPFALCPFAAPFPFSACPFAHCLSAARSLALLIVPPPPECAIVRLKAFGFFSMLASSLRLRIVFADL